MSAEIIQLRDYQNPKDLARMYSEGLDIIYQAATAEFSAQPDFSSAAAYHAPDGKEPA